MIKFGDERLPQRFWDKVRVTGSGCWEWTGSTVNGGYGSYRLNRRSELAHRVIYRTVVGGVSDGLVVRHDCDNPPCVNPAHLRVGTEKDNMQDCLKRGRNHWATLTQCKWGHPLSGDNLHIGPDGNRKCRACGRERMRRHRRRNIGTVSSGSSSEAAA